MFRDQNYQKEISTKEVPILDTPDKVKDKISYIYQLAQDNTKSTPNVNNSGFLDSNNHYQVIINPSTGLFFVYEQLFNDKDKRVIPFSFGIQENIATLIYHPENSLPYSEQLKPLKKSDIKVEIDPFNDREVFQDKYYQDLGPKVHTYITLKLEEVQKAFSKGN